MLKLVVRRLLSAIAVLFVVSLITFVVLLCIPGDPAQLILGVEATPEKVEALRASMGLDRPWYVQYMHWIQGVLTGNWGTSYLYGENVWTLICFPLLSPLRCCPWQPHLLYPLFWESWPR